MKTWQKWLVGLGIILSAIGGYVAATFDGDDSTTASLIETVDRVKEGITIIRTPAAATEAADTTPSGDTAATGE